MKYQVSYTKAAVKQLKKLDKQTAKSIINYMQDIQKLKNPRARGKKLSGDLCEFWRYRVGDFRILCKIEDDILIVLVIAVGHRKDVYR